MVYGPPMLRPGIGRTFVLCSLCLAAGLFPPAVARATPQDLFGFGLRSPALGQTGVSYSDDFEAAFTNPAGLARARRRSITLGFHAGVYDLEVDGRRFPIDASRGLLIGFELPVPFGGFLEDRIVIGGGFYTPAKALLEGTIAYPEAPQFLVLERAQATAVQVGVGFDMHGWVDGLRLGAGVSVTADVLGDLFVRLDETNSFSSQVESQLVAAYAPMAGVSWDDETVGFGVVYRAELMGVMNLAVTTSDLPVAVPVLAIGGIVHYDPPMLAGEAFYRPLPDLMLVAHLTTRFWSAYPGPQQKTTSSSNLAPDPDFSTVLSPRVAAEGTLRDGRLALHLRGGYVFEPSPSPPARMAPLRDRSGAATSDLVPMRHLDNDRHVLTAGAGLTYELDESTRLSFDMYGQLHLLTTREHDIGVREGADDMETSGTVLAGGWSMGLEF